MTDINEAIEANAVNEAATATAKPTMTTTEEFLAEIAAKKARILRNQQEIRFRDALHTQLCAEQTAKHAEETLAIAKKGVAIAQRFVAAIRTEIDAGGTGTETWERYYDGYFDLPAEAA